MAEIPINDAARYRRSMSAADLDPEPEDWPMGPKGRRLCRCGCGVEVPKRRRKFASKECSDSWACRFRPNWARWLVQQRDHGVCAVCGIDTNALRDALTDLWEAGTRSVVGKYGTWGESRAFSDFVSRNGFRGWRDAIWHMDHIVPVVEGGGACGLENLRTLCLRCHKKDTRALARRRAETRRGQIPLMVIDG